MARWSFWPRRRRRSSFSEPIAPPYITGPRRRRKRDKDTDEGGVPVEPNKPNTLSGGAAAELEFDD
jgi:hypothetical protein